MPYGKKAHIEVGNDGPAAVAMTWEVSQAPLDQPIEKLARFHVTNAPDYGIFQLSLGGAKVGSLIDLYGPKIVAPEPIDLGVVTIAKDGNPVVTVNLTGKNAASSNNFFGLDYIKLTPAP